MKVHGYALTNEVGDGAPAPRAWRIATDEGVFWLAEAGNTARLIGLPLPDGIDRQAPFQDDGPWAALAAFASTAEAEAAGRWVGGERPLAVNPQLSDTADAPS